MNSESTEDTTLDQGDLVAGPDISVQKDSMTYENIFTKTTQSVNTINQSAGDSVDIQDIAHVNDMTSIINGFFETLSADPLTRDALARSIGIKNESNAAMLSDTNSALQWADAQVTLKTERLARLDRERDELLAQCDRARRDIDLRCNTITARLDNECNELNARTMSAKETQMSLFAQKRAELKRQLDEMDMYQELASQLLDPSRSSAEVCQYAPVLMSTMRASCSAAQTDDTLNDTGLEPVGFEFVPADNLTGENLLGTLVMSERETDEVRNNELVS